MSAVADGGAAEKPAPIPTWADVLGDAVAKCAAIATSAGRSLEWARKRIAMRAHDRADEVRLQGRAFWDSARLGPAVRVGPRQYAPSHQYTPHPDGPKKRGTWKPRKAAT